MVRRIFPNATILIRNFRAALSKISAYRH